jgi:glycerol-3-phosphate acyltransferase PlsY
MSSLVCLCLAYLIGSISFAIVASRMLNLPDPRSYGSGNPGATNVLRSGRKMAALVTLVGDAVKGLAVVLLAHSAAPVLGFGELTVAGCAVAAFFGHLYPIYFGFKGGKGVATALGVLLGLSPLVTLVAFVAFVVVAALSRYVSLASIVAALVGVVASPVLLGWSAYTGAILLVLAMVIWRHRANMRRLRLGTESKLNFRRSHIPPADPAA